MSEQLSKYLKLARSARADDNTKDAKLYYDMVRADDPENGEAAFFSQYYGLYEGTNGELATRFTNLTKVLPTSVKSIANASCDDAEKLEELKAVVDAFTPMTWNLNRYMNKLKVGSGSDSTRVLSDADIQSVGVKGVIALYDLGDLIASTFSGDPDAQKLALIPWKEGVTLQQKWYAFGYNGKTAASYAEKIKKIEPEYVMPKKAGCISFADNR